MTSDAPQESYLTLGKDELVATQLDGLRKTFSAARDGVPHYRSSFDAMGICLDDLKSLDELRSLPLTTKEDLRVQYPFGMFAVPTEAIVRVHASSGTTGKPTVVGYSSRDIQTWTGLMARSIAAAGGSRQDIFHNSFGYGLFTGGIGFHYGAEALGCMVIPCSGGMTERQVRLICDFRPDIIGVTPSYLMAIADEFDRQGIDPRTSSLRLAICGAEPWTEPMRDELEARLGLVALNHYGLSEMMGPGVGQELAIAPDGITIWEDHFLPEIIDPATGAPLPDGEFGELVLTSLTREAMPMIRYRTRDLTRLLPGTASNMRRIDRIRGRSDDMLIVRGVNVFPSQIEEIIGKEQDLFPHYLIEVERPATLDVMRVIVEARRPVCADESMRIAHRTEQSVKALVGITTEVTIVAPGALPRSQGKAVRVLDKRQDAR